MARDDISAVKSINRCPTLCCALLLLCLAACGPIKGYPGPELPAEMLAQVSYQEPVWSVAVDDQKVTTSGITLLPGEHKIDATRLWKRKYDCFSHDEFDSWGYDQCRDHREHEIRNGKDARSCYASSYTKTITNCLVDNTRFYCQAFVKLLANRHYVVRDSGKKEGPMSLYTERGLLSQIPCRYDTEWTEREEQ